MCVCAFMCVARILQSSLVARLLRGRSKVKLLSPPLEPGNKANSSHTIHPRGGRYSTSFKVQSIYYLSKTAFHCACVVSRFVSFIAAILLKM